MPRPSSRNALLAASALVLAFAAIATVAALRLGLIPSPWRARAGARRAAAPVQPAGTLRAALDLAAAWVNGAPADLAGHPALILVWCDTHPDGVAALAQAADIADAYARYGVRVIGVHEPDFAFSADTAATARAARRAGVRFPIALDPAGRVAGKLGVTELRAAALLADTAGAVYAPRRGWRGVAATEMALRAMLERLHPEVRFPAAGGATAAEQFPGRIESVYLGVGRAREGPLTTAAAGRAVPFTAQFRFEVEGKDLVPYPVGWWKPEADGLVAARGGAATFVALRYEGGALDAVLSPPAGAHARVWILSDEHWLPAAQLGADARLDARGGSYVEVDEPRLYRIARGNGTHLVKLSPDAAGVTFHAFLVEPAGEEPPTR